MTEPAFIAAAAVAKLFGVRADAFADRRKGSLRQRLALAGFPEPDPVVGKFVRADVEAWIEGRRRIGGGVDNSGGSRINLDAA